MDGMKVAIIGGGVIGAGWAARFLLNNCDVQVFDPAPDAEKKLQATLENARRSLPALSDNHVMQEGKLTFAATLEDAVSGAVWVQESLPERLETKHQIIRQIEAATSPDCLIASSTSGFKPSQLQEAANYPNRIFVAHPFNPVYLIPVVELIGEANTLSRAAALLEAIGMKPIVVRKEIEAHVADRLLEAVWREALWLIKDDIATTQEIDNIIRYGFGLRWAQMGLFETYRIAGGEAGMAHFLAQFGPALKWPWTKLMDVPELDDALIAKIATQSDAQSGTREIGELERIRDDNLVAILRALKGRNWGAGTLLREQDQAQKPALPHDIEKPLPTLSRIVPIDWTDYNGHMNESRYGQVFSDAGDVIMEMVGADQAYIASGLSYFTVDNHIRYLNETNAGDEIYVTSQVLEGKAKKLRMYHEMFHADGRLLATCNQLLIHVSLETRRSCDPAPHVLEKLEALGEAQAKLPLPESLEPRR